MTRRSRLFLELRFPMYCGSYGIHYKIEIIVKTYNNQFYILSESDTGTLSTLSGGLFSIAITSIGYQILIKEQFGRLWPNATKKSGRLPSRDSVTSRKPRIPTAAAHTVFFHSTCPYNTH